MKILLAILVTLLVAPASKAGKEEAQKGPYKTLPCFGIPDAFYTDNEFYPYIYLNLFRVADSKAKLSHSEKLSAALLIITANHPTYEKYHQSYGVSFGSPLLNLLKNNFLGLDNVEPTHDVTLGDIPIRDIAQFFRAWLKNDLSEDLQ